MDDQNDRRAATPLPPADLEQGADVRERSRREELGEAARRLAEHFVGDVLQDWQANGAMAIAAVRAERPLEFLKLVTGLLPKQMDAKVDRLDEFTDEQLARQLATVLARLAEAGADLRHRAGVPDPA